MLANVVWALIFLLVVFWLVGFVAHVAGSLIHVLLVIVVILVLYNLFVRTPRNL